jgi:hypothetical protein
VSQFLDLSTDTQHAYLQTLDNLIVAKNMMESGLGVDDNEWFESDAYGSNSFLWILLKALFGEECREEYSGDDGGPFIKASLTEEGIEAINDFCGDSFICEFTGSGPIVIAKEHGIYIDVNSDSFWIHGIFDDFIELAKLWSEHKQKGGDLDANKDHIG